MNINAYSKKYSILLKEQSVDYTIQPSQGDGWIIKTKYGYIDYRHDPLNDTNEIWWVESHKKDHGSQLVDLMQQKHPASNIAWGATSISGEKLMTKWHGQHPDIQCITGDHEGQFNPFDHDNAEDEFEDEFGEDERL